MKNQFCLLFDSEILLEKECKRESFVILCGDLLLHLYLHIHSEAFAATYGCFAATYGCSHRWVNHLLLLPNESVSFAILSRGKINVSKLLISYTFNSDNLFLWGVLGILCG